MTDRYQKEIEDKKISEENLLEEVGKTKYVWRFVIFLKIKNLYETVN